MKRIRLTGVRCGLLQTLRLSHALNEAGVPIAVSKTRADAWRWLDRYFDGLDWRVTRLARRFENVRVDHHRPLTRVGDVERPLLFPHSVLDVCREKWSDRPRVVTFAGMMTDARKHALEPLTLAFGRDFEVLATNAGRVWPTKAWDDEYFVRLGQSQLTACPNGDFGWTYRFFEAAMCGSIPVVEDECELYDGVRFYRMTDPPGSMRWTPDWADHNAALVRERITASHDVLRSACGVTTSSRWAMR